MADKEERPRSYTPLALAALAFVIFATLVIGRYVSSKQDKSVLVTLTETLGPCKNTTECDTRCKNDHDNGDGICDETLTCLCRYRTKQDPLPPNPRCVADLSEGCNETCHDDCCSNKCGLQYQGGRGFCSTTEPVYVVALCSCDYPC